MEPGTDGSCKSVKRSSVHLSLCIHKGTDQSMLGFLNIRCIHILYNIANYKTQKEQLKQSFKIKIKSSHVNCHYRYRHHLHRNLRHLVRAMNNHTHVMNQILCS